MASSFTFFSNRASKNFEKALVPIGGVIFDKNSSPSCGMTLDFLYFDQYGGKKPPTDEVAFRLMPRQKTMQLDNKLTMARHLKKHRMDYPRVFFDPQDLPNEPDTLWFLKDPGSSGGKGIKILNTFEVVKHHQENQIIQEAITHLALIDGKKFTVRMYVLCFDNKIFMYPEGIIVVHGKHYEKNSRDPEVQFIHDGYDNPDKAVYMLRLSEYEHYTQVLPKMEKVVCESFSPFKTYLKSGAMEYCLFGIDLLITEDLNVALIEINDRPNLKHSTEINETVNVGMIRSMLLTLSPTLQYNNESEPTALAFQHVASL